MSLFFKRIICILIGHNWKYVENYIANELDWKCNRCGKRTTLKIEGASKPWWTMRG